MHAYSMILNASGFPFKSLVKMDAQLKVSSTFQVVVLLNWTPKTSFRLDRRNSTFSCQLDLSLAPLLISVALVPLLLFSLLTMAPLLMSIISLQVLLLSLLILAPPLLPLILAPLLNLVKLVTLPPARIQNNAENENIAGVETQEEFMNHNKTPFGELDTCSSHRITIEPTVAVGGQPVNNLAIRPADNNKDNQQEVLIKEEEYVLASIGIVISDLCGLKKMIPIEKLHSELIACYSATWPRRQVQMHLAPEAGSSAAGTECKPWFKLMYLLRKYPERFTVMNSSCDEKGQATSVYVTLNSLWPC
uniref:Uncharacterized protein n=1 Tax=Oryza punctata TaxID=4537 RepID=A0A0E0M329_ORYPU